MLEALGFTLAMIGFGLMSINILFIGLLTTIIGDTILVVYGLVTSQFWLAGANVIYILLAAIGIIKCLRA